MHHLLVVLYLLCCAALLAYSALYIPPARRWLWPVWAMTAVLIVYVGVRAW
jgi:hypothetical protein